MYDRVRRTYPHAHTHTQNKQLEVTVKTLSCFYIYHRKNTQNCK